MTYSFDVFDTCLTRICGDPKNVFEILSIKVMEMAGLSPGNWEHSRKLFVAARMQFWGKLEDIYRDIEKIFPLPCSIKKMASLEMETEREVLMPIQATAQLIESLRSKGQILFISDMYLPTSFIKEQLLRFGFFRENDLLFVSDDIGASKGNGSLYRRIKLAITKSHVNSVYMLIGFTMTISTTKSYGGRHLHLPSHGQALQQVLVVLCVFSLMLYPSNQPLFAISRLP